MRQFVWNFDIISVYWVQRDGKPLPQASLPFHRAMPGMTHMALVELEKAGILKFVISQVCATCSDLSPLTLLGLAIY